MNGVSPEFEREANTILEKSKALLPPGWVQVVIVAKTGESGVRFHTNMDCTPDLLREVADALDQIAAGKSFNGRRA